MDSPEVPARPPFDCLPDNQRAVLFVYAGLPQLRVGVAVVQLDLVAYTQLGCIGGVDEHEIVLPNHKINK
jgi:hypothetical protein